MLNYKDRHLSNFESNNNFKAQHLVGVVGIVSNESKKRHVCKSHIVHIEKFSSVYNGISCRSLQEHQALWAL